MSARFKRHLSDKVEVQEILTLHTTHQDIANDLHTSRVVVSWLPKGFEKEEVLSLHRNAIEMATF